MTLNTPGGGAVGATVGEAVGVGDADDGVGDGLADARAVGLAVGRDGGVDPDEQHETDASTLIDPNTTNKKLPRCKRNRGS